MNAFVHPPNRNLFLATLISSVVLVASLLPLSGAESKSKKSPTKSAASSTPKAKKSSSDSSDTAAAKKAKASPTPQKKSTSTASATPKKASSKVAKATPASGKKRGKTAAAEETAENKKSEAQTSSTTERSTTPSSPQKTGISGQPAPPLPQSKPAPEAEQGSAAESPSGDTSGSEKAMIASIPTPPTPPVVESKPPENAPATNGKGERRAVSPNVSLDPEDLLGFDEQPLRVQQLIKAALDLAKQKLTYTYGSADPANGGMDCSGAIHHLLTQQGFKDVPRDASGQYVWARKTGKFFAVVSKKADSFEFGDLLPGDILFWNGTYKSDRDPPVTHTMIYLGIQRKRAQHVMWGSSDGRTYDGKPRWGVSVFDFKMPRADKNILEGAKADFLGYARIPGLRE